MSIQHMQMVFDAAGLGPREKAVLLAYCNYTDPHGYVWAGVDRICDDSGASASTIKRARAELQAAGLLATKRRVNPRTGESISNLTRINLGKLAAMKRAPKVYDDNLVEALTFAENEPSEKAPDLPTVQDDPGPDLRMGQSDPTPGVNLTSPYGGVNLTPDPSVDPSSSSSARVTAAPEEEEEDEPKPKHARPSAAGIVAEATGATPEEAQAVVERLETTAERQGRPIGAMAAYVRGCAAEDLRRHLAAVRRAAAPTPRPRAGEGLVCGEHANTALPCHHCRGAILGGDLDVAEALLAAAGPQARPDLAEWLSEEEEFAAAGGAR